MDQNQQIAWQAAYEPFGEVNITTALVENNLGFPGQYFDAGTGLYYNWFRYYDPNIGRYITSDPIGLLKSFNSPIFENLRLLNIYPTTGLFPNAFELNHLYAYVDLSPLNHIDPYGLAKDNWHGYNDRNFRDWVHQIKQDEGRGGAQNYTKEELNELWKQWNDEGRPGGKGRKSGKGGLLKRCLGFIAPGLAELFYPSPDRACDIYQDQHPACKEIR